MLDNCCNFWLYSVIVKYLGKMKGRSFCDNILIVPSVQPLVLQVVSHSLSNDFNDKWKTGQSEVCPSPFLLVEVYNNCLCCASNNRPEMFEWILKSAQQLHGWRQTVGQSEQGGGRGKQGEARRWRLKTKRWDEFCFAVFAQAESRITKYRIIQVTYLLRLSGGQYRAEPTQICPLGNAHLLASSHKDVPSYPSCWLHYYDSQHLMEISPHWGLLLILLAPVWN